MEEFDALLLVFVLFCYCYITNYQKLSCLKQHTFIISVFPWMGSSAILNLILCSGYHKVQSSCWAAFSPGG